MTRSHYLYSVTPELATQARAAGLLDEHGHVSREICTCGSTYWGWGLHSGSCPVRWFYIDGGCCATRVLQATLKRQGETS